MIYIGVIGIGYMGNQYLKILSTLSKTNEYKDKIFIKKIADPNFEKLIPLKNIYQIPEITAKPEEILEDKEIKAVFIASPPFFHFEQAKKAIKNKKAVYCEKPLTPDSKLSFELSKIAEKDKIINQVGLVLRNSPTILFIKEIIDRKEYGEVNYINLIHDAQFSHTNPIYHTDWRKNTGRILAGELKECNVHDFDLIFYLFDIKKYPEINCFYEGKNFYHSKMKYKSIEITFTTLWHKVLGRGTKRRFEIFFEKAVLFAEDFFTYGDIKIHPSESKIKAFNKKEIFDEFINKNGLPQILKEKKGLYSFIPILNFINCILANKNASPNFKDCARAEKFSEILMEFSLKSPFS